MEGPDLLTVNFVVHGTTSSIESIRGRDPVEGASSPRNKCLMTTHSVRANGAGLRKKKPLPVVVHKTVPALPSAILGSEHDRLECNNVRISNAPGDRL